MATLAAAAVAQNAPVTVLNHPTGAHAFESVNDDEMTRIVINQTIDFVKRATSPTYQSALRAGLPEAIAAGHVSTGNFKAAASVYAKLVEVRPDDARLRLSYGSPCSPTRSSPRRAANSRSSKAKGSVHAISGCRPLARARRWGMATVPWRGSRSIPSRFLPPDVQKDRRTRLAARPAGFSGPLQAVIR